VGHNDKWATHTANNNKQQQQHNISQNKKHTNKTEQTHIEHEHIWTVKTHTMGYSLLQLIRQTFI